MNIKRVTVDGQEHYIDFPCYITDDNKIWCWVDNVAHHLTAYYRHERTWDEHLGNAPCGYYVIAPIGKHHIRVYIYY